MISGNSVCSKLSIEKKTITSESRVPHLKNSAQLTQISREKRKSLLFTNPNLALGLVSRSPCNSPGLGGISPASDTVSQITSSVLSGRTPNMTNFSKLTNLAGYSIDISPLQKSFQNDDNFGTRVQQIDRSRFSFTEFMKQETPQKVKEQAKVLKDEEKKGLPPKIPLHSIQRSQSRVDKSSYRVLHHKKSLFTKSEDGRLEDRSTPSGKRFEFGDHTHLSLTMDDLTTTNVSTWKISGKKIINQYIVLGELARGSYGKVKKVLNKQSKKIFAMKIIKRAKLMKTRLSKDKTAFDNVEREVAIMKKLQHQNVVRLLQVMDDPNCEKLYLVMELLSGGSVQQLMDSKMSSSNPHGALSPSQCRQFLIQVIQGLEYCHEAVCPSIIHRDIKPANLLLDQSKRVLKIADFGVASILQHSRKDVRGTVGSSYFMAPEVTQGYPHCGKASDIWSTGVTLFKMIIGVYPFTGSSIPQLYKRIQNEEPTFPSEMDPDLRDLLEKLLKKDPKERLKLEGIKTHPWLTQSGICILPSSFKEPILVEQDDLDHAITSVTTNSDIRVKFRKH